MHPIELRKKLFRYIGLVLITVGVCFSAIAIFRHFNILPITESDSVSGNYLAGWYAAGESDFDKAALHFKKSLDLDPENKKILMDTYATFVFIGKIDEAIKLIHRHAKDHPASLTGGLILAVPAIKAENYSKAIEIIEENAKYNTPIDKFIIPYIVSWCKMGEEKAEEAIANFQSILQNHKEPNPFAHYQIALMYDLANFNKQAEEHYAEALRTSDKSYRFVKNIGNFYERIGKKEEARKLYEYYDSIENLTDLFGDITARLDQDAPPPPKFISSPKKGIIDVLLEVVGSLYKNELYREALIYLQMVIYLEPDNAQAQFLLGAFYEQTGQYKKAIAHFSKIPKKTDFYWQGKIHIIESYYRSNHIYKAKKLLISHYNERPFDKEAGLLLAEIFRSESDYLRAAKVYTSILKNIPAIQASDWNIFYYKAINDDQAGYWEKAEASLRKALELQPNQADVLNYLGYSLLIRHKNIQEAAELVKKALDQRPDNPQNLDSMGWALYELGDYENALIYLEKALELQPDDSTINDHLGDIYWKLGRKTEAYFQWEHALTSSPEKKDIQLIQQKLETGLPDNPPAYSAKKQ
jgi:tetratricopeptide (TPR) repeat protein